MSRCSRHTNDDAAGRYDGTPQGCEGARSGPDDDFAHRAVPAYLGAFTDDDAAERDAFADARAARDERCVRSFVEPSHVRFEVRARCADVMPWPLVHPNIEPLAGLEPRNEPVAHQATSLG